MIVFTGSASPKLAEAIIKRLGILLDKTLVGRFSDDEVRIEIQENVRGKHIFILQSTYAPTNDNLVELMMMVGALERMSTRRITAAIPYSGYARQDRRPRSVHMAVTAKAVANVLEIVGVERVLTINLHADQIQGFFDIPVDNIYTSPILPEDLRKKSYEDLLMVSPGIDGVVHARALAKQLGVSLAIIDKRCPRANVAEMMNIIGEVDDRNCVIMGDIIDTDGTLHKAAQMLKECDAKQMFSYCTYPMLSGDAIARITDSALDEMVVADAIPLREDAIKRDRVRQLLTAPSLAGAFTRIVCSDSVMLLSVE